MAAQHAALSPVFVGPREQPSVPGVVRPQRPLLRARHVLPTAALDYDLPADLVAIRPAEPRDAARLMVVWRSDPARIEHRVFSELPVYLRRNDLLIANRSSVLPARLHARRPGSGGSVTGLYLGSAEPGVWRVLLRSSNRLRSGEVLELVGPEPAESGSAGFSLVLLDRKGEGWFARLVPASQGGQPLDDRAVLRRVGTTPLPPYILKARKDAGASVADELDRAWYQTVYAGPDAAGSVAAPTAGLHFTPELLARLEQSGIRRAEVTLHVGAGTFKPVQTETVEAHPIHAEWFRTPPEALQAALASREAGGRVIAAGTTTVRALESAPWPATPADLREGASGETRLLATPGFRFNWTDGLVTNFHLPRSTLLALVAAMLPEGAPRLMELYREAVRLRYRFYSYGDAMLILP